ncbi:hypothetical protein SLEP1_g53105 [Rubroshorea leprosula]|uniref:Uncharacterized protein n=1 Tax=Rubroshorea leprosula TaxID=152421 RepID=A0AAV5M9C1_9ROSI|nr:hypothetical protein SLEP1_g53105 [Rubroshorea leprosula]
MEEYQINSLVLGLFKTDTFVAHLGSLSTSENHHRMELKKREPAEKTRSQGGEGDGDGDGDNSKQGEK